MSDYKELPLIGKDAAGLTAKVDPDVWEWARYFPWYINHSGYPKAFRSADGYTGVLHRIIMGAPEGLEVHHVNGDTLDARRANLRIMTRKDHIWTRGPLARRRGATSKYKGVQQIKARKTPTWIALARINGQRRYFGTFKSEEEAARAYDEAVLREVGPHAYLNFPPSGGEGV